MPWRIASPDILASNFAVNPPQQAAEHAPRADLIKLVDPLCEQPPHRVFPINWRNDLPRHQTANLFGIFVRLGVDVGDHRNSWLVQRDIRQRGHKLIDTACMIGV